MLIVGYGSIGARHARLLVDAGCDVAVVSNRNVDFTKRYRTLEQGWRTHCPTIVILANTTAMHHESLAELSKLGHSGDVLVEKPLFDRVTQIPKNNFRQVLVAYNLRFHPVLINLRELIKEEHVISAHAYVGHFFPIGVRIQTTGDATLLIESRVVGCC